MSAATEPMICAHCGIEFVGTDRRNNCCSQSCGARMRTRSPLPRVILGEVDRTWQLDAKCRTVEDKNFFFPSNITGVNQAKAFCANCPVRQECLDYAMETNQMDGVWGGHCERERDRLRWRMRKQRNRANA